MRQWDKVESFLVSDGVDLYNFTADCLTHFSHQLLRLSNNFSKYFIFYHCDALKGLFCASQQLTSKK